MEKYLFFLADVLQLDDFRFQISIQLASGTLLETDSFSALLFLLIKNAAGYFSICTMHLTVAKIVPSTFSTIK